MGKQEAFRLEFINFIFQHTLPKEYLLMQNRKKRQRGYRRCLRRCDLCALG